MSDEPGRDQLIRQIVASLAAAVHDVELETHDEEPHILTHFVDNDFVYQTLYGYRALGDAPDLELLNLRSATTMLRSGSANLRAVDLSHQLLWSALLNLSRFGQWLDVPRLRMLLPHFDEFAQSIKNSPGPDKRHRRSILLSLAPAEYYQAVLDSIHGADDRAGEYIDAVGDSGLPLMVALDLTRNDVEARVRHLLDSGIGHNTSMLIEDSDLFDSDFAYIESALRPIRVAAMQNEREVRAHLRDAAALSSLASSIRRRPTRDGYVHVVRFYTHTRALRDFVVGDERGLFSYEATVTKGWHGGAHTVLRDHYYYLFRSLIEWVKFGRRERVPDPIRESVIRVQDSLLSEQTDTGVASILSALRGESPSQDSVLDVIETFSDVGFAAAAWPVWREHATDLVAADIEDIVDSIRDIERYEEEHRTVISQEIQTRVRQSSTRLYSIRTVVDAIAHMLPQISEYRSDLQLIASHPGSAADSLGIARWSFQRDDAILKSLRDVLLTYKNDLNEGVDVDAADSNLAIDVAARVSSSEGSSERRIAGVLILHLLRAYSVATEVTHELAEDLRSTLDKDRGSAIKSSRYVLIAVLDVLSRFWQRHGGLRGGADELLHQNERIIATSIRDLERISQHVRSFEGSAQQAMARAHLHFVGWSAVNDGFEASADLRRGDESNAFDQLVQAVDTTERALSARENSADAVTRMWLLNALVYYMSVGNLETSPRGRGLNELSAELLSIADSDHDGWNWSYRFSDTLAMYYVLRARQSLRADDRSKATQLLQEADRWITHAKSLPHLDPDVDAHGRLVRHLRLSLI